jgi:hypothetical protein
MLLSIIIKYTQFFLLTGLGGFKKVTDARPKLKKRSSQVINPRDVYPQLSCLNKDEMLSHGT